MSRMLACELHSKRWIFCGLFCHMWFCVIIRDHRPISHHCERQHMWVVWIWRCFDLHCSWVQPYVQRNPPSHAHHPSSLVCPRALLSLTIPSEFRILHAAYVKWPIVYSFDDAPVWLGDDTRLPIFYEGYVCIVNQRTKLQLEYLTVCGEHEDVTATKKWYHRGCPKRMVKWDCLHPGRIQRHQERSWSTSLYHGRN